MDRAMLQTIEIHESQHNLAGIRTIKYILNKTDRVLIINANGVDIRRFEGKEAITIFNKMSE